MPVPVLTLSRAEQASSAIDAPRARALPPHARAPDRLTLAKSLSRQGHPQRAYAIALELYEAALARGDDASLAESADLLTYCCIVMAQYEQGIPFARAALARWQARADTRRQSGAHANLAMLLSIVGDPDALAAAALALDLADRGGDAEAMIWALQANCQVLCLLRQPDRAVPFGERAVALGNRARAPCLAALVNLAEALVCAARADAPASACVLQTAVDRALGLMREALDLARTEGDGQMERLVLGNVAEYSLYVGDTVTADAALAAFDAAAGTPTHLCRAHHMLLRGRSFAAQGRQAEAIAALQECCALSLAQDFIEVGCMAHLDLSDLQAGAGAFAPALAAHRTYHALSVRQASEAAQRRARVYAVQRETQELRAQATEAQARAMDLIASNALLAKEAERHLRTSLEDPLTGLPNRRRLDAAFADVAASGTPFALAMIDVDHFKQVNDCHSHAVGDAVLRKLAKLLSEGSRRRDLVVRYGGEEFALLMDATDLETARQACERLRATIAAHVWDELHPQLSVTVSIGVAASAEAAACRDVLALADRRLYCGKARGRNRVVER